ncbi:pyridoxamine 5'-phosphate oxidase family protein [Salsipaludibacter albus]|uniref:pyridoxamine 5'-phosphate oxidase family protein n=1 Tax=Salsipaludibacter albus TaxID=2849650 RepID=UPI001EE3A4CF|nr:pyridoxamine 5'-phosphate oxidase family protein [Salsipaludibacter albus]
MTTDERTARELAQEHAYRDDGNLVELDVDTCLGLLAGHEVGRLALNDDPGPLVMPVNYVVDGGTVAFRTTWGSKLDAAEQHRPASFQVDHLDVGRRIGWSVLVRGRLREVTDPDEIDLLDGLSLQPWAGGDKAHWVRVMAAAITGRWIPIAADDDDPPVTAPA